MYTVCGALCLFLFYFKSIVFKMEDPLGLGNVKMTND